EAELTTDSCLSRCSEDRQDTPGYFDKTWACRGGLLIFAAKAQVMVDGEMRIAIVGPGGIGSTFAFQLSEAGHDVTVIARSTRLEQLRHAGAIVTVEGE